MNALISVLLLLTVLWEMDESPQQKPETWKKKNNDEKEGNERQFEADGVIIRSETLRWGGTAVVGARLRNSWVTREGRPSRGYQTVVARCWNIWTADREFVSLASRRRTSWRHNCNIWGKVWRELDLTLKKGVWKVASGLEGNIPPSGRAQIKQEMTSDWP